MADCNGNNTQQWHHVHNYSTPEWHPEMAPSNGTISTPLKGVVPPFPRHSTWSSPYHNTLEWHPAMAPRPLPPPPHHSTIQWQWHSAMARPLPQSWSSPSPPTIPHHNGTLMAPRPLHPAMARWVPRPIRQSGSSASPPLLEVRTPIAIAIWGNIRWILRFLSTKKHGECLVPEGPRPL